MNIISFSWWKDSTAMLLKMIENWEKIDKIVFADPWFEFPELYEYIKEIEKYIWRKIEYVYPKSSFEERMNWKITRWKRKWEYRWFPLRLFPCYWMREAKYKPLENAKKWYNSAFCLWIAVDEQHRVQKKENIRYPLIERWWTENDCLEYLKEKNLLNPLYNIFSRIWCYFCPKQNLNSLYWLWKNYNDLFEKIKKYDRKQMKLRWEHILFVWWKNIYELEKKFKSNLFFDEEETKEHLSKDCKKYVVCKYSIEF